MLAIALSTVAACGGGGGGSSSFSSSSVNGTAAFGSPVANAAVTIKDSLGATATTVTSAAGRYSLAVPHLTPPFLIQIDNGAGTVLYSIAFGPGVANVTGFTDRIVDAACAAQGASVDEVFADPTRIAAISRNSIRLVEGVFETMLQKWIQDAGLTPAHFDLFNTAFSANGSGFDGVLDFTTFTGNTGLTIDDGTTTQTSDVVTDAAGHVTVDTTTVGPLGTTTSHDETFIPTTVNDPLDAAVTGADANFDSLQRIANSRRLGMFNTDFQPLISTSCGDDGQDQELVSDVFATILRYLHTDDARVERVFGYDDVNKVLDAYMSLTLSYQGHSVTTRSRESFRQETSGGPFLYLGNQRIAETDVAIETRTDSLPTGTSTATSVNVDVLAPQSTVASVVVSSDDPVPLFNGTIVPLLPDPSIFTLQPTPTTLFDFIQDEYKVSSGPIATIPPPGTHFTFTVIELVSGTHFDYVVTSHSTANEPVTLLGPTGHTLADARQGGRLAVTWSLPTSYPVDFIELTSEFDDNLGNRFPGNSDETFFENTATIGHVRFPTLCPNGAPLKTASFDLSFDGPNGERSVLHYEFSGS